MIRSLPNVSDCTAKTLTKPSSYTQKTSHSRHRFHVTECRSSWWQSRTLRIRCPNYKTDDFNKETCPGRYGLHNQREESGWWARDKKVIHILEMVVSYNWSVHEPIHIIIWTPTYEWYWLIVWTLVHDWYAIRCASYSKKSCVWKRLDHLLKVVNHSNLRN